MTTAPTIVGNAARFFRDGTAYTVPSAGTAGREALPGDADTGWIDLGPIVEISVEKVHEAKEVWKPNPGRIELYEVVETKRGVTHRFTLQELSALAIELMFGADALTAASTDFTALAGNTKKGWLHIKQYNHNDTLFNTIWCYGYIAVAGAVNLGADLVAVQIEHRQLISTLNKGTLVAS